MTFLGNGTFEVADRNLANGTEGTDLLSRVEFVRFGDGSQYALSDLVVTEVWHEIPADVELVAATYQFFTGAIPGAAGFEYLIASTQNAKDNGVTLNAAMPDAANGEYPVVLANILATPLKLLAPLLCNHLRPGAHLVLAGILERQADELKAAYAPHVALEVADSEDGWILMTARRPA